MDVDRGWDEGAQNDSFLDPEDHVVSGSSRIVSEVVVQA